MYRWLAFRGVSDPFLQRTWKLKIPAKIKFFLWQVIHDRLPTREQILIRHGNTSGKCPICDGLESINHLLFCCPQAAFVWSIFASVVGWPAGPSCVMELLAISKQNDGAKFDFVWVGASAVLWALWNTRNKLIFEGKILKQPTDVFFLIFSYLQSWRPLWSGSLLEVIDWVVARCRKKIKRFRRRVDHG
jgi:hypothetical protein